MISRGVSAMVIIVYSTDMDDLDQREVQAVPQKAMDGAPLLVAVRWSSRTEPSGKPGGQNQVLSISSGFWTASTCPECELSLISSTRFSLERSMCISISPLARLTFWS